MIVMNVNIRRNGGRGNGKISQAASFMCVARILSTHLKFGGDFQPTGAIDVNGYYFIRRPTGAVKGDRVYGSTTEKSRVAGDVDETTETPWA